jgi:hypothetical protein
MLYETRPGYRRLFRPNDDWHPGRNGGRTQPTVRALSERHRSLLQWYEQWIHRHGGTGADPILALRGLGREIWADESADEYVASLRRGWE